MKIAIVVLNWNGEKYLSKCLTSLEKLDKGSHSVETVVVDNGSTDKSIDLIKKDFPKMTLIETDQNLGYAGGNNVGLDYALKNNFDWVWIVNPDIQVEKKALTSLLEKVTEDSKIGAAGSKVYFAKGFEFHKDRYTKSDLGKVIWFAGGKMDWDNVFSVHEGMNEVDQGQFDTTHEVEFLTGSSMLLSCKVLQEVGLLDDRYFLYFEETDLCLRIAHAGYKLLYVHDSKVWHANAQATEAGSGRVDYYTTRNRLLFGMQWASLRSKWNLLKQSVQLLLSGRIWQKRGVVDFYLNRFGQGSYVN